MYSGLSFLCVPNILTEAETWESTGGRTVTKPPVFHTESLRACPTTRKGTARTPKYWFETGPATPVN
jgi:hypothetical protein